MTKETEDKIINFTRGYYKYALSEDGFGIERYVDYRDEFPQSEIRKILNSDNPQETFCSITDDWELSCDDWYYEDDFWQQFKDFCNENGISDEENPNDVVRGNFYWHYPDSFLNPTFKAVIRINTGDGNYDYTLHNVLNYASDYGYKQNSRGGLDKKAGLYWLAKQQRRLGLLQKEITKSDHYSNGDCKESKFVSSCITELVNLPSYMGALTFLVEMNLQDAIKILQTLKDNEKNYSWYNPQDTKDCPFGYVTLDKSTECGLYDRWNGSGSVLEIELERDVKIPLHFITSIDTDDDIQRVYGLCGSCWKDTVKEIA